MLTVPGQQQDEPKQPEKPTFRLRDAYRAAQVEEAELDGAVRQTVKDAHPIAPERAARVLRMQFRTGVERDIVDQNLDELEQEAAAAGFDAQALRRSPKMERWLTQSKDHMSIGRADMAALVDIERRFVRKDDPNRPLSDAEVEAEVDRAAARRAPDLFQEMQTQTDASGLLRVDDLGRPFYQGPTGKTVEELQKKLRQQLLEERQEEERWIASVDQIGFGEAMVRRANENPLFLIPFLSSLGDAAKQLELYRAAKAVEAGTHTEDQKDFLLRYTRLAAAAERRGTSVLGKTAEILAALPAVAGEFAATGGSYRAAKVGVERTLRKATERAISGVVQSAIGTTVAAGVQTGAMSLPRIAGGTAERMLPGISVKPDQEGKLQLALDPMAADGFGAALLKSAGTEFIQTLSERTGAGVERLVAPLKKAIAARWIKAHPAEGVEGFLSKVKDATGWNGILGEMFEERVAEVLQAPIDGYHAPTADQLYAEMLAFSVPAIPGVAARALTRRKVTEQDQVKALADSELVRIVGETVRDMKMQDVAPDQLKDALKTMVAGTNAENMYVDAKRFVGYFADKKDEAGAPVDVKAMAERMGVARAAFDEAVARGGDLKLKTADMFVEISPTDHLTFMQDELRTDPLRMSAAQTRELLTEQEKDAIASKAMETLSEENLKKIALKVSKKERRQALKDLESTDIIGQVQNAFGPRLFWQKAPGMGNAEELLTSGVPRSMIGDPLKAAEQGYAYAAPADVVAERFGMTTEELIDAISDASRRRTEAEAEIESTEVPEHVYSAVLEREFQEEVRRGIDEAETEKAAERASARARQKKMVGEASKAFGQQIRQAMSASGFARDSATYGLLAETLFRRAAERTDLGEVEKLFRQYNLTISRQEQAAPPSPAVQSLQQPDVAVDELPYDKNEKLSPVDVPGGLFQAEQSKLWKVAQAWYRSNLQGKKIDNRHLGKISFSNEGKKKSMSLSGGRVEPVRVAVVKALPELARIAVPIERARDTRARQDISGYVYAVAPVRVEGKVYAVQLTLREIAARPGEPSFYNFVGFELDQAGGAGASASQDQPEGATRATPQAQDAAASAVPEGPVEEETPAPELSFSVDQLKAAVKANRRLFQPGELEPRGQINIGVGANREMSIDLFRKADRSTALHELGHFYLEVLGDLVSLPSATQELKDDYKAILDWLGVGGRSQVKREHHEQWARGFERYLMEGRAPNPKLRGAFYRFKKWLTDLYRELLNLNVELSDEIRGVFDRMLATEEEITSARTEEEIVPLFEEAKDSGMTDVEATAYAKAQKGLEEEAERVLGVRMMDEIRRQDEEWWTETLDRVRVEVAQDVDAMPVYRALSVFRTGNLPDGTPAPFMGGGKIKLKRDDVQKIMPDEIGAGVSPKIPKFVYAAKGGVSPNVAADWFGFASGQELLEAIAEAKPRDEFVEELAKGRMEAEHGEAPSEEEVRRRAAEALHNDDYEQMLEIEMQALARQAAAGQRNVGGHVALAPKMSVYKDKAIEAIIRMKVGEIDPRQYQGAARRAARDAVRLWKKGDHAGALRAKADQALNAAYFRAASKAKEAVNEALVDWQKIVRKDDAKLAKSRDVDLVNAARAILARINIGKADRTASSYLKDLKDYDPDTHEALLAKVEDASGNDRAYSELTYEEFIHVREAIDALWDLSIRTHQFEVEGKKMDLKDVADQLMARLDAIKKPEARAGYDHAVGKAEEWKLTLLGWKASLRRTESLVDLLDGGNPNGVFRRYVWTPVSEGADLAREKKGDLNRKLAELLKPIEADLTPDKIDAPELGYVFGENGSGLGELLGAIGHTGNPSNFQKLLRGHKWGEYDEDGILDTSRWDRFMARMFRDKVLKKEHFDALQGIWDLLEGEKAAVWKAHKDMYGFFPDPVTAAPVVTPFGTYRGGYMPAIADPLKATDAAQREERAAFERNDNSYAFPTTGKGSTMKRSEGYAAPLQTDLRYLRSHLGWLSRFTFLEPRVKDAGRLFWNKEFRARVDQFDPALVSDMLIPWLQRAATQMVETPMKGAAGRGAARFFRGLRKRTGLLLMAGNFVNAAQNVTGLSLAALKVKPRYLAGALGRYTGDPKGTMAEIREKSVFMKNRTDTETSALMNEMDEMLLNPSAYEKVKEFAERHGYFLQRAVQNVVDAVAWQGAYEQAVAEGADQKSAVRQADSAVRLTQGSSAAEDISRAETGTAFVRAFTQFWGYFNMWANLLGTEFGKVGQELGLKNGAGRGLYVYTMGLLIPTLLAETIMTMSKGGFDDDDDDGYLDEVMASLWLGQFRSLTGMVPFGVLARYAVGDQDRVGASPAINILEQAGRAPASVYKAIAEDGKSSKAIKDVLSLIGLLSGLPTGIVARPASYLADVAEEEVEPSGPIDFSRGLLTGKPGDRR